MMRNGDNDADGGDVDAVTDVGCDDDDGEEHFPCLTYSTTAARG